MMPIVGTIKIALILLGAAMLLWFGGKSAVEGLRSAPDEQKARRGCLGALVGVLVIVAALIVF